MASAKMASSDSRLNCCESTTCFSLVLCHEVAVSECEFVLIALTRPAAARRLAAGRATAVRMHCCAACCRRALVWRPEPRSDWCCMGLLMHSLRALITGKSTLFRVTRDYSVRFALWGLLQVLQQKPLAAFGVGFEDSPMMHQQLWDSRHKTSAIKGASQPVAGLNTKKMAEVLTCIITVLLQNHSSPLYPR